MSGNALEEGVLGQLQSPTHLDSARIAVPFGAILAILSYLGLGSLFPGLHGGVKLILVLLLFFGLTAFLLHRVGQRQARRAATEMEATRTSQNTETERQLAQMKKSS